MRSSRTLHHGRSAGAHGVTRTRIFTSVYGSPVRSRRRVRAHGTTSGVRSRVSALRELHPGPLDDGGVVAAAARLERATSALTARRSAAELRGIKVVENPGNAPG